MSSIALVLSAGGPYATAFHAGALAALLDDAGWDARTATLIVGTSAGSSAAAMLRGGFSPHDEFARVTGAALSADGQAFADKVRADAPTDPDHDHSDDHNHGHRARPLSVRMALTGLLPHHFRPGLTFAGLSPRGTHTLRRVGATARAAHDQRWPDAATWVVAVRRRDGARAVFGRDDLPATDIGTAVEASSAIPSVYRPVRIGRHDFIDGAVHSSTNADLVAPLGFDAVVVVSAMTAERPHASWGRRTMTRAYFSRRLDHELRAIRGHGVPVLVVQPSAADLAVRQPEIDDRAITAIAEQAKRTTADLLRRQSATAVRAVLDRVTVR